VTQGRLENGVFVASEVLAKHDENYMPPAAADAVKKAQAINEKATRTVVNSPQSKSGASNQ
jgi:cytochrome c-type biogenesis protein CcmE